MATLASPRPRVKPSRSVRVIVPPSNLLPGIVIITAGKVTTDYFVSPMPTDFGRGFKLVKVLGEHDAYHVCLNGRESLCDCKGHLAHGHCKHVAGLQALCDANRL